MIRNIIFDWSGTLVNDLPAAWEATNHVFKQAGVPEITLEQFRAEFVLPFKHFYAQHVPQLSEAQIEEWFHARFQEVEHTVEELPHARDFLIYCREQGYRTFLLSSLHKRHFQAQTSRSRFDEYLDHPYLGVWDKRTCIKEIIQQHGLNPKETLFIGDMQHDIETAKYGEVWSCAVLTGFNRLEQLQASRPDLIVEHLGELLTMMRRKALEFPITSIIYSHDKAMPIATVGGLIFNENNEVLMVRTHKWADKWGIPGGKIKWGESSEDALRRELREETGLEVTDIRFVMVQDCIHSQEYYRDAHFVLLNYTCKCRGKPEIRLNEEAQAYRWIGLNKLAELDLNIPTKNLIKKIETFVTFPC